MDGDRSKDGGVFLERYWPDQDGLPKHEKLRRAVAASIVDGYWRPGARLPTETEWVAATPCSLGTVQRALRALVDDGLILRRQGSGTTVAEFAPTLDDPLHMRFYDEVDGQRHYLPLTSKILRRQTIRESGPWSEEINQEGRDVVRIDRIMIVAGHLDVYSAYFAIAEVFPDLVELPIEVLNGVDLKQILAKRARTPMHRVRQHMRFEAPPEHVVANCRWPKGASASVLNVVGYTVDGAPMYYQDFYIPPSPYTLDLGTPIQP